LRNGKKEGANINYKHIRIQMDVDVISQGIRMISKRNREVIHGYLCESWGTWARSKPFEKTGVKFSERVTPGDSSHRLERCAPL